MNGHWKSRARGAWTAVSRAPYLRAVSLFAKGDCWHGGGLFVDNTRFWLNDGYGHEALEQSPEVTRALPAPYAPTWGGECTGVYFHRLLRDGWVMFADKKPRRFERALAHGWTLRKLAYAQSPQRPGRSVYFDTHVLVQPDGSEIAHDDWEWADVDRGRLVWATGGGLYAARVGKRGLLDETLLHDFNAMEFEARVAPYE